MIKKWVFLVFVVFLDVSIASTIPDFVKVCRRTDPDLGTCLKQSVENLKPALIKGIPEMHVPPLDPFKMANAPLFDGTQIPNLKASIANLIVTGLSNFDVTKVKLDVDKHIYRVAVKLPFIDIQGDYDVDAQLLGTKIHSTGNIKANASGIVANAVLNGAVDDRNRLKIESIVLKITVEGVGLNLDNVLNENPDLKRTVQLFLSNANQRELIEMALPYIETKCAAILLRMTNDILKNFDYDDLFPV